MVEAPLGPTNESWTPRAGADRLQPEAQNGALAHGCCLAIGLRTVFWGRNRPLTRAG